MSVKFDWKGLNDNISNEVQNWINEKLSSIDLPTFLANLEVSFLDLGTIAPDVEILDIIDPDSSLFHFDDSPDDNVSLSDGHNPGSSTPRVLRENGTFFNPDTLQTHLEQLPPTYSEVFGASFNLFQVRQRIDCSLRTNLREPSLNSHYGSSRSDPLENCISSKPQSTTFPHFHPNMNYPFPAGLSGFSSPSISSSVVDDGRLDMLRNTPAINFTDGDSWFDGPRRAARDTSERTSFRKYPHINDLQFVARLRYNGDVNLKVDADLRMDYPNPQFIALPIRLSISKITLDGIAAIMYIKNKVHFTILDTYEDEKQKPFLRDISIDCEIGEEGRQVLKNVDKVETFLLDVFRDVIAKEFVIPNFYTFVIA